MMAKMAKKTAVLFALILLLVAGLPRIIDVHAGQAAPYDAEQIYSMFGDSVFYIRTLNEGGSVKNAGTGVLLSADGVAATAYHVVKDADRIEATLPDGRVVGPVEVTGYDELTDAAVLKLPVPRASAGQATSYKPLSVRESAVKYGETVFAIGYPLAGTPIITTGIVNAPKAKINGRNRILTSAQIASGMSGGPLIDRQGQLVGIISGSLRTMDNINLIVDTTDLQSVMKVPTSNR